MSMCRCVECGWNIDSDEDCDCFVGDETICESCRFDMVVSGEIIETESGYKFAEAK